VVQSATVDDCFAIDQVFYTPDPVAHHSRFTKQMDTRTREKTARRMGLRAIYTNPDQVYGVTDGRGKAILDIFSSSTRQIHTRWVYIGVALALAINTTAAAQTAPTPTTTTTKNSASTILPKTVAPPLVFDQTIQPGDRVLFVGDELTQQMFYTRATATALLAMMPNADLRFFNGGRDEATAASTLQWIDPLLALCQPSVVFVCLGLNDGHLRDPGTTSALLFKKNLTTLVKRIQSNATVRQVVILGPPAIQAQLSEPLPPTSYNQTLKDLSDQAWQTATELGIGFIDLFEHTKAAYLSSNEVGGEPLTRNGKLPTESGHVIIASIVLRGIGASVRQLEPLGWSPLRPIQMSRIRQALALPLKPVGIEAAQKSRTLYESISRFDEAFFRLWRLASRQKSGSKKDTYLANMGQAWADVVFLAQQYK